MKGEIAIILVGLMILPVIALAKTNSEATEQTCEQYCNAQPHVDCVGEWKITGKYPDCKCEFKCSIKENSNNNKDNSVGPWNALLKNKKLCKADMTTDTQVLLLKNKKGNFEAWTFNTGDNSVNHYVAFPASWYKPKVIEKKIQKEHWQSINIAAEDPRVVQCGILPGDYIVKA